MHHAALAHATIEIAVGGGAADLTIGQHAVAHAQAGAAGGVGDTNPCIHENIDQSLVQGLTVHRWRGRRNDGPNRVTDFFPLKHLGGNAQVADPAVGAGTDIHLIDRGAGHLGHGFHIVRLVAEGHHGVSDWRHRN